MCKSQFCQFFLANKRLVPTATKQLVYWTFCKSPDNSLLKGGKQNGNNQSIDQTRQTS